MHVLGDRVASLAALLQQALHADVWRPDGGPRPMMFIAEYLLARGVQYAPREPATIDTPTGRIRVPSLAELDGAAPPREPPPTQCPTCGAPAEERLETVVISEAHEHHGIQFPTLTGSAYRWHYVGGRPEGPSAPPQPSEAAIEAAVDRLPNAMTIPDSANFKYLRAALRAAYAVDFGSRSPDPQERPNGNT